MATIARLKCVIDCKADAASLIEFARWSEAHLQVTHVRQAALSHGWRLASRSLLFVTPPSRDEIRKWVWTPNSTVRDS